MADRMSTGAVVMVTLLFAAAPATVAAGRSLRQDAPSPDARALYLKHCARCHGDDGTPKAIAKDAPTFTSAAWVPRPERIAKAIADGKGEIMPRFKGKLTPADIESLVTYLVNLKRQPRP